MTKSVMLIGLMFLHCLLFCSCANHEVYNPEWKKSSHFKAYTPAETVNESDNKFDLSCAVGDFDSSHLIDVYGSTTHWNLQAFGIGVKKDLIDKLNESMMCKSVKSSENGKYDVIITGRINSIDYDWVNSFFISDPVKWKASASLTYNVKINTDIGYEFSNTILINNSIYQGPFNYFALPLMLLQDEMAVKVIDDMSKSRQIQKLSELYPSDGSAVGNNRNDIQNKNRAKSNEAKRIRACIRNCNNAQIRCATRCTSNAMSSIISGNSAAVQGMACNNNCENTFKVCESDCNSSSEQEEERNREEELRQQARQDANDSRQMNDALMTGLQSMQNSINQGAATLNYANQVNRDVDDQLRRQKQEREREREALELQRQQKEEAARQLREAENRRVERQREQERINLAAKELQAKVERERAAKEAERKALAAQAAKEQLAREKQQNALIAQNNASQYTLGTSGSYELTPQQRQQQLQQLQQQKQQSQQQSGINFQLLPQKEPQAPQEENIPEPSVWNEQKQSPLGGENSGKLEMFVRNNSKITTIFIKEVFINGSKYCRCGWQGGFIKPQAVGMVAWCNEYQDVYWDGSSWKSKNENWGISGWTYTWERAKKQSGAFIEIIGGM